MAAVWGGSEAEAVSTGPRGGSDGEIQTDGGLAWVGMVSALSYLAWTDVCKCATAVVACV